MSILDQVNSPSDIKKLNLEQLSLLCAEIRSLLIKTVSENGGHIASNLGVVEVTIALHRVFDSPRDKIIWDVGHQSYVHKILTGRKDAISTIRKYGGISGFPKTSESEHDIFNTGHSSTSISAALGIAQANRLLGNDNFTIAVIGDGALTGGLAYEALNNAGGTETNLIVVLNDNEMSISKNVGSMTNYLNKLRTQPFYFKLKKTVERTINKIPVVGENIVKALYNTKSGIKHLFLPGTFFEELGFTYIGPIDGHDIKLMTTVFERAKHLNQPVLVHVLTKKGKGYGFAEKSPALYHGTSGFDVKKPLDGKINLDSFSNVFGKKLLQLGEKNENVVAVTAAMGGATGMSFFQKKFPQRFFDVGISEGHAITFCCGLAATGKIPVVAIYSTFLQRAYDNIVHDLALQNLHVVMCLDRCGLVGEDGETHHGIFDVSYLSHIPGITIFTPSNKKELEAALETAVCQVKGPVAVRYPKGNADEGQQVEDIYAGVLLREGKSVTVVTMSRMTNVVKKVKFDGDHIHLNCIKPIDIQCIIRSLKKTGKLVTVEDNIIAGGMGECVVRELGKHGIYTKAIHLGVDDRFVTHGKISQLLTELELDEKSLERKLNSL